MNKDDKKDYYVKGIPVPETPVSDVTAEPWKKTKIVGKALPRVDGYDRVSGSAIYASDITMPEMLYGAILRCPHPHAIVKAVDTKEAEKMPGVRAVISGSSPEADILWPYSKDMKMKLFDPHCRYEGEVVAAVAAETPYHAWDALKAIRVDYEVLPYIADERKSLSAGAPKIHEAGNKVNADIYERGDVKKGFSEADVVLEQKYRTACEIHTPMELHGCAAKWDGDSLTIWESTQGVYSIQARVAEVLRLPARKGSRNQPLHGRRFREQGPGGKEHDHRRRAREENSKAREALPHARGDPPGRGKPAPGEHDHQGWCQKGRYGHGPGVYWPGHGRRLSGRRDRTPRLARSRPLYMSQCPLRNYGRLYKRRTGEAFQGARPSTGVMGFGTNDGFPCRGRRPGPGGDTS